MLELNDYTRIPTGCFKDPLDLSNVADEDFIRSYHTKVIFCIAVDIVFDSFPDFFIGGVNVINCSLDKPSGNLQSYNQRLRTL